MKRFTMFCLTIFGLIAMPTVTSADTSATVLLDRPDSCESGAYQLIHASGRDTLIRQVSAITLGADSTIVFDAAQPFTIAGGQVRAIFADRRGPDRVVFMDNDRLKWRLECDGHAIFWGSVTTGIGASLVLFGAKIMSGARGSIVYSSDLERMVGGVILGYGALVGTGGILMIDFGAKRWKLDNAFARKQGLR